MVTVYWNAEYKKPHLYVSGAPFTVRLFMYFKYLFIYDLQWQVVQYYNDSLTQFTSTYTWCRQK